MSEQVPGKFPPRVRVWNTSKCGELNVAAMSGDWRGLKVAVPEDYISLQEHEAIVERRMAEVGFDAEDAEEIASLLDTLVLHENATLEAGVERGLSTSVRSVVARAKAQSKCLRKYAASAQAAQKGETADG